MSYAYGSSYDDGMEIDEQILNDVATLRASNWDASGVSTFEDVNTHTDGANYFVVLDSNVLISYLGLVRQLLDEIFAQKLPMALCLPSVVVAELNFLKERNPNPNTRALAQEANVWLLAQVRSRTGIVRGQQKQESLLESQTKGKGVNDDQIVDYCAYLRSRIQGRQGLVCLLSNDQNCCLKAELQGITTISPKPRTSARSLFPVLTGAAHPSSLSQHYEKTAGSTSNSHGARVADAPSMESMDVDEDAFISPSASHPLSLLHSEFLNYLSNILPVLAYDAALVEQAKRTKEGKPASDAPGKKSSLHASIHAPKEPESYRSTRAFIMPSQDDVQTWTVLDCIHFGLDFPPRAETGPKQSKLRPPSISKLKLFLLPHDQPGGRRGKDWSMGDWNLSLEQLDDVAVYCGWKSVQECVDICRKQLHALYPT